MNLNQTLIFHPGVTERNVVKGEAEERWGGGGGGGQIQRERDLRNNLKLECLSQSLPGVGTDTEG